MASSSAQTANGRSVITAGDPAIDIDPDLLDGRPLRCGAAIDVWTLRLDQGTDRVEQLGSLLSDEERRRAANFRFEHLRRRFTVCRGALRLLLAQHLGLPAVHVHLIRNRFGKPLVAANGSPIRFNVSHSHGRALVAIAAGGQEVGVDLERMDPIADIDGLIRGVFSVAERAEFRGLDAHDRLRGFYDGWTRKEAYVKALGIGLQQPLDAFDVTLAPSVPARLIRVEGDADAPARWAIESLPIGDGFAAAICYDRSRHNQARTSH